MLSEMNILRKLSHLEAEIHSLRKEVEKGVKIKKEDRSLFGEFPSFLSLTDQEIEEAQGIWEKGKKNKNS